MIVTMRAQNFPDNLEAAQLLAENLAGAIREAVVEYNRTERPTGPAMAKLHELEKRQAALNQHIGLLLDAAQIERDAAAHKARRPKRKLPEPFPLVKKSKAMLAAEREVEFAAVKVGKAYDALRAFAATEHADSFKAGQQSIVLQGAHSAASRDHTAASIKFGAERAAWQAACAAALDAEFKARESEAHELLDKLEDLIGPLRSRTFIAMKKLRALRKVLQ